MSFKLVILITPRLNMDDDQRDRATRANGAVQPLANPSDQEAFVLERTAQHPLALISTLTRTCDEKYSPLRCNILHIGGGTFLCRYLTSNIETV